MKIFSNLKNKVQMKILDLILARGLEMFKTKSPKLFAIIVLIAVSLHQWAQAQLTAFEVFTATHPDMVDHVQGFTGVSPIIAEGAYYLSMVILALGGAHTSQILSTEKPPQP
jgi:hypothetical protein